MTFNYGILGHGRLLQVHYTRSTVTVCSDRTIDSTSLVYTCNWVTKNYIYDFICIILTASDIYILYLFKYCILSNVTICIIE